MYVPLVRNKEGHAAVIKRTLGEILIVGPPTCNIAITNLLFLQHPLLIRHLWINLERWYCTPPTTICYCVLRKYNQSIAKHARLDASHGFAVFTSCNSTALRFHRCKRIHRSSPFTLSSAWILQRLPIKFLPDANFEFHINSLRCHRSL